MKKEEYQTGNMPLKWPHAFIVYQNGINGL